MLLRRAFSIHDVRSDYGGTIEFVFAVSGKGTEWLASRRARDVLDVTGPLGRPFPLPRDPVSCLLVGGGYGSAPLFSLGDALLRRGCRVDFALGAASAERVFGALTARRLAQRLRPVAAAATGVARHTEQGEIARHQRPAGHLRRDGQRLQH